MSVQCQLGERHDDLTQSCRQCKPGTYGMQDQDTRLGSCVACKIGVEVQPLPAQQQCARCDAKDRIPVDCGLPGKIQVYKGYYRPDGVPPTVSLLSRDGSASGDAGGARHCYGRRVPMGHQGVRWRSTAASRHWPPRTLVPSAGLAGSEARVASQG